MIDQWLWRLWNVYRVRKILLFLVYNKSSEQKINSISIIMYNKIAENAITELSHRAIWGSNCKQNFSKIVENS